MAHTSTERAWWLWPSALSLDAPAVALAWQDLLGRTDGIVPRLEGRLALGLTVWAVYLADRLIDSRSDSSAGERPPHWFSRRHRWIAIALLIAALVADSFLALFRLRPQVLANGFWIAAAVTLYLTAFAWRSWFHAAKPWAAATLFAAGVFLVAWTRDHEKGAVLILQAVIFFALCLGNLMVTRSPRVVGGAMALLAASCLLRLDSLWFVAAASGAAGLMVVALLRPRFSAQTIGLLADIALLLPALRLWALIA